MPPTGVKKYRRPDGSTYTQYGGPKSAQDVEVVETAPTPAATPAPAPTPATKATTTSGGTATTQDVATKRAQTEAERATEAAKATEKFAPWLGEGPKPVEGGLGGASKRAVEKHKDVSDEVSAAAAGDAVANAEDEKKKKKPKP